MSGFRGGSAGPVDVRVVPHPAVTLVLEFGNGPLVVDAVTGRRQQGIHVAGFLHGAVRVRGENVECVQVRLSPLVACAVLGASPSELNHTVVALDDLWGRDAAGIRQRLGDATSCQDRFALAEALLVRRAQTGPSVDLQVAWAWDRLVLSHDQARIEELAAEVGWSRKRLWSRFRLQIGAPRGRSASTMPPTAWPRAKAGPRSR
ncbi:hypothetical protein ACIBU0_33360 [Streptomyces sp. NPDC049627]|uniref:hypothetical protein n=1 Tax=Streptomyces sp. NPDC049627 TaxID=3365595 RepID=UPI00379BBBE1